MMADQVVQAVIKYWTSIDLKPFEGASAYTIATIEAYFDISVSEELRAFYSHANGIFDEDDKGFAFYSLEEWKNYTDVFQEDALGFRDQGKICIIFIDYLQASWYYALLFDRQTNSYTVGILPHGAMFVPMTSSFSEFLKWYVKDDEILYRWR